MEELISAVVLFVFAIFLVVVISIFLAFPIMWCWNYVMPYLFSLKEISWGHAWCLSFLANSLIRNAYTNTVKK